MLVRWNKVDYVPKENPWVTYIKYKVFEQNNCINAAFTGKPGMGKSWAMLSLACKIDPDFELEGNWFFKAGKMMRAVKEYYEKDKYKTGKFWCIDEAGIDLNNLKYQDEINRGYNAFFQTARHRNYIFLCSVPFITFMSKGVRTLMTTQFTAQGWNNDNQTKLMPRIIEYNPERDRFYKKRLIVDKEGDRIYCNNILVPKPPKKIRLEYEKIKKEFTTKLFEDTANKIEGYELKQLKKNNFANKLLTDRQETVLALLKKGLTLPQIAEKMGIHKSSVTAKITSIRQKGIDILVKPKQHAPPEYVIRDPREEYKPHYPKLKEKNMIEQLIET